MPNTMHLTVDGIGPDLKVYACPNPTCAEDNPRHSGTTVAGYLERGRARASVINGQDRLWDEWQFVPNDIREDAAPVRDTPTAAIDARTDARIYVQAMAL
jgi:hypothetical protein